MKVLIVYASSGSGHWKAAEALHEILKERRGLEVSLVDSLQYTTPRFRWSYPRTYIFLVRYLPSVWGFFYGILDHPLLRTLVAKTRRILNGSNGAPLVAYLKREQPEVILSTHFFASEIAGTLKQKGLLRSRLYTVITDFGIHGVWVNEGTDGYFVGSDALKALLQERGVSPERIHLAGIPVHPKFEAKKDRQTLAGSLGLHPALFTVLVASGGFGVGPIEHLVKALASYPSLQLLVVCGRNERLFRALSAKRFPGRIHLFHFVDNMDELMTVSDCMIGKSGGLTMSEALMKRLPTLILFPIPGQEDANRLFFTEQGAALSMNSLCEVEKRFRDFEGLKQQLQQIQRRLEALSFEGSGRRIVALALGEKDG